ncbi:MAG: M20/M25/M40 family metallo-hydrolase [Bacteroidota bacterium]
MIQRFIVFILVLTNIITAYAQESECATALLQVKQDSLVHFVKVLSGRQAVVINGQSEVIESRFATHPGNNLAAEYIKQTVIGYGFNVQDIPFSSSGRNIVAFKNGTDIITQAYILSAHYDCVGNATMQFQGADDNASGVAALLEAARVLQSINFPYTIILAFWDEEENGLLGSKAFAPDGPLGFWDVKAALNLDMIGYDGNHDSLAMIHTFPVGNSVSLADKLMEMSLTYEMGLHTLIKNPGDKSTDHQSFWSVGATAVGLTEDYDHDFNPNWHLWGDSIENMHLPYFTQMSKLAIVSICDISKTGKLTGERELSSFTFSLYPNPVSDVLHLQLNRFIQTGEVRVYDIMGTCVQHTLITGNELILPLAPLPSGYYIVEIHSEEGQTRRSFIKAN